MIQLRRKKVTWVIYKLLSAQAEIVPLGLAIYVAFI